MARQAKTLDTDVLIIGGGINGAGIARDLAGRGLSVVLCEKDDLASATSSASTKLIHGGLRYLEYYEFRLVREALIEREVLLRSAPHIIRPLTFVLPHQAEQRPAWLIRLGLFLYDYLGGFKGRRLLAGSRGVNLKAGQMGRPLMAGYRKGFTYSDCWVDDSRLVALNALAAHEKGAVILTQVECTAARPRKDGKPGWEATLKNHNQGNHYKVRAALVVNAAGPWVERVAGMAAPGVTRHRLRLVKGSHIIVPQVYVGDHAYILQNPDRRIVFAIPYEGKYTLVGTTDVDFKGDPGEVHADAAEVEYLCKSVNRYFSKKIKPEHVLWTYSGVRPLLDDGGDKASAVTRDYVLELDMVDGAPLLSVFGGKITTFRRLAEQASDRIVATLGRGTGAWTREASLPGGDMPTFIFETFFKTFRKEFNWIPEDLMRRYARAYGTRTRVFLRGCRRMADLGRHFGDDVYEVEIRYLVAHEWALTAEDVLWRRSKLGLHVSDKTKKAIEKFMETLAAEGAPA